MYESTLKGDKYTGMNFLKRKNMYFGRISFNFWFFISKSYMNNEYIDMHIEK